MATTRTRIDLSRLAPTGGPVVGRAAQLESLDAAWHDPDTRLLWIRADSGMGKSTLVNEWLARMQERGFPGAERIFGWTFHGQGAGPAHASADAFLDRALPFFDDGGPAAGSPWERGARLARRIQGHRTLLVLDGVEIHQDRTDADPGRVVDPSLAALVRALRRRNPGLCVITSRLPQAEAAAAAPPGGPGAKELALDEAAVEKLFAGLDAEEEHVRSAFTRLSGHPFALAILEAHLREAFGGDVEAGMESVFPSGSPAPDDPVLHMLSACEAWLKADPGRARFLSLLRLAGVLDGPADRAAVRAVRGEEEIPGLTEGLGPAVSDTDVAVAAALLRQARLLAADNPQPAGGIDTPRPVRRHFHARLPADARTTASSRLFDHFCGVAPEVPETLEDLLCLHAAVVHGCRAGRPQDAWDRVYRRRISPEGRFWSTFRLGAFDAEATVLSSFFDRADSGETLWASPLAGLDEGARLSALMAAGVTLRSLGRLAEARTAFEAALAMAEAAEEGAPARDPGRAADAASCLSEVALARGRIDDAVVHARTAVAHADASGDLLRRAAKRAYLADALHQAGRFGEADTAFREAEAVQKGWQPRFPLLYSLRGYQFHDLLLREPEALLLGVGEPPPADQRRRAEAQAQRVLDRVQQLFPWRHDRDSALDVALEHLVRGRARLARDLARGEAPSDAAGARLDQAVRLLREYAAQYRLPWGLLARAAYRRLTEDFEGAAADLDEALGIAEHGEMRLLQVDVHLERARLEHARDDLDGARQELKAARDLMKDRGYHRRDREVADLAEALAQPG